MTPPTPDRNRTPMDDALERIDPFAALMDGRQQLIAAVTTALSQGLTSNDLATTLAIVAAHDAALTEVALAWSRDEREFDAITSPADRMLTVQDLDEAMEYRVALFEALGQIADALDEFCTTPWGGPDSWRMHIVAIAMHDGAQAYEITQRAQRQ